LRVLALDPDLIVLTSDFWQTNCVAVRAGDEGFVIDSPLFPSELDALPGVLEQAGFPVSGLLATHGDWDHVLGRLAFPDASLGCGETTVRRLAGEPGAAQRELREFDEQNYVAGRRPLSLGGLQSLPVPGKLSLGPTRELELHHADGHTVDGTAFAIGWLGVLVCGDYISPVEIPWISDGGSPTAYAATLERLHSLIEQATTVVPGHGAPVERGAALRIVHEDLAYLDALVAHGPDAPLPPGRRTAAQRKIHEENVGRVR
jgi:glyoxylase-like metal-dependent hydrolase (beta-lactamase superfamily II)